MARQSQSAEPGNEVDQTVITNGNLVRPTPFQQLLDTMALTATIETEENTFTGDDVSAILTAETDEEIWDADDRGPLNFQHLAGCDIAIVDYHVKFSRPNAEVEKTVFTVTDPKSGQSRKMYLLVDLMRTTKEQADRNVKLPDVGEVFQVNTSARFVVCKIWQFGKRGKIDRDSGKQLHAYVQSTDLGGGQAVIKLRPPRYQAVQPVA